MLSEEEASKRWCPHTRMSPVSDDGKYVAPAFNSTVWPEGEIKRTTCIGSKCMAWRWTKPQKELAYPAPRGNLIGITGAFGTSWSEPPRPSWINSEWTWDERRAMWTFDGIVSDPGGYCGLAGED
jgi:hypothetical protein